MTNYDYTSVPSYVAPTDDKMQQAATEIANWLRTKGYGKDVRESMAQAVQLFGAVAARTIKLKQDIYDELKAYTPQSSGVGGINISDGKVTGFSTQYYWSYAQYDVDENLTLNVSFGKSFNTLVTGHIFATDDNNTILASIVPGGGNTENIDNYKIVTPEGTTKLFIQSYLNYKISVNGELYQPLLELKQEIDGEFKEYTPQSSGIGGVNVSDSTVTGFGTETYWSYGQYNVDGNLALNVSFGKSFNTAVTGHIFATDDNNKILASFVPGGGDAENIDNYAIVTPGGTTKLFIQSYLNYKISVNGSMYQTLSESINTNIDDELKIYKEINNSNVYNFISRQGMLDGYPENSNEAVLHVKQNGFNHVRVSVAFTSDNVPVLIHDASINRVARNSDGSTISSTINIADITLEQANTYDWGRVASQGHKGMTIPLLSDFLKICSFKSIFPTLEFKPSTATDDQLKSIINMVDEYGLADKTYFASTVDAILLSVNKINPSINIGFIAQLNSETLVDRAVQFKTDVNKVRIDMFDTNTPSIDVINYASSKGVGIKVGSAYSLADIAKFASMGVTDIEVAYVAFPATALNEYYDTL
ncbi:glycerophosphodiester phosphodiesterase [Lactiplantibacillus plantarum]